MAKAYDVRGNNASIAEMIEKTEVKLRIPGAGGAATAANPPPAPAAPSPPGRHGRVAKPNSAEPRPG